MVEYLQIKEWKIIDVLSNHSTVVGKINNLNCNGYVHDKLRKELKSVALK